jgi:hypothetical protein
MNTPSPTPAAFDPGPSLLCPSSRMEVASVWRYIFQKRRFQIFVLVFGAVCVLASILFFDELKPSFFSDAPQPSTTALVTSTTNTSVPQALIAVPSVGGFFDRLLQWAKKLEFIFGIFTALIAAFVWYGEIREDWEQELPCIMSVFFFYKGKPAIICRNIWLSGPDDLRNWSQQVAAQAATPLNGQSPRLEFGPDVKTQSPEICIKPDGTLCRHYTVRFLLTNLPKMLEGKEEICRYQNLLGTGATQSNIVAQSTDTSLIEPIPEVAAQRPLV